MTDTLTLNDLERLCNDAEASVIYPTLIFRIKRKRCQPQQRIRLLPGVMGEVLDIEYSGMAIVSVSISDMRKFIARARTQEITAHD